MGIAFNMNYSRTKEANATKKKNSPLKIYSEETKFKVSNYFI